MRGQPLRVLDLQVSGISGVLGQREGRVPVGAERADRVVLHPLGPPQHADVELEDRPRVAAGDHDRHHRRRAEHDEAQPQAQLVSTGYVRCASCDSTRQQSRTGAPFAASRTRNFLIGRRQQAAQCIRGKALPLPLSAESPRLSPADRPPWLSGLSVAGHGAEQAGYHVERGHAEPFDDGGRGGVALVDLGQHLGQAERAEGVIQDGAGSLGGVALAPRTGGQAVEDLQAEVFQRPQAGRADQARAVPLVDQPQAVSGSAELPRGVCSR
jgi:hypothetical protein